MESASPQEILDWAEQQPWAKEMACCAQDAHWHAEGDVWTHTRMVVAELLRLDEWPTLENEEQLKLIFTALFHDAGKPVTTRLDSLTGRTHSPKHAIVGMEICRTVLRQLGSSLAFREAVANLVRYHGRPAFLLEKPDPAKEVISLSWLLDHRLLYWFALADTRGRATTEMTRPEENLHLWKMVAEENGCFGQPYRFANDHARFLYFQDRLSSLYYSPREDYRCRVLLLSGMPGSGKDTWLAKNATDLPVVSLDDIRSDLDVDPADEQGTVIQVAREKCREHLRTGRDFAFNATNILRQTRNRWIDLFADYGARIEIVYLEPPLPLLRERNRHRHCPVPETVMERLLRKLEPPTAIEGHDVKLFE